MQTQNLLLILALTGLLSALLIACNQPDQPIDRVTSIRGWVVDSLTAEPVAGAAVVLHDTSQIELFPVTDSVGRFSVGDFGFGTFRLYCLKDGYATKYLDVTSSQGSSIIDSVIIELVRIGN